MIENEGLVCLFIILKYNRIEFVRSLFKPISPEEKAEQERKLKEALEKANTRSYGGRRTRKHRSKKRHTKRRSRK